MAEEFVFLSMKLDDIYFMRQALQEAEKAQFSNEVPVGAIVVVNQQIIARAYNLTERLKDVTAHAEMQAITSAAHNLNSKYLIGCTLYVTLEPCIMCAGALAWSQIERVVFGAPDRKRGFQNTFITLHPKTSVKGSVLESESKALMNAFFAKKRL